ncbi:MULTISPECIES: hypothetical protein [Roseomonadaceae]|uniref:Uncharacterized protein n=1 Tax=Falsiroseomonas oleicola TaxID=2801474 RepID=A0ABS6HAP2_9PROT|nr:hypothetical protein [Roseomonas oleicola]MBU8544390.1 hypothetical protein [Roseomonas oleicola]
MRLDFAMGWTPLRRSLGYVLLIIALCLALRGWFEIAGIPAMASSVLVPALAVPIALIVARFGGGVSMRYPWGLLIGLAGMTNLLALAERPVVAITVTVGGMVSALAAQRLIRERGPS